MDGWQEQICILTSIEISAQYWTVWRQNIKKTHIKTYKRCKHLKSIEIYTQGRRKKQCVNLWENNMITKGNVPRRSFSHNKPFLCKYMLPKRPFYTLCKQSSVLSRDGFPWALYFKFQYMIQGSLSEERLAFLNGSIDGCALWSVGVKFTPWTESQRELLVISNKIGLNRIKKYGLIGLKVLDQM